MYDWEVDNEPGCFTSIWIIFVGLCGLISLGLGLYAGFNNEFDRGAFFLVLSIINWQYFDEITDK